MTRTGKGMAGEEERERKRDERESAGEKPRRKQRYRGSLFHDLE